eukprot:Colp12_sorted_trinity150504_noHs@12989
MDPGELLCRVAIKGDADILKEQLERGGLPFIDRTNKKGQTPLLAAIFNCQVETALLLIQSGANLNVKDATNSTPLISAICNGMTEVVEEILKHPERLDVNCVDNDGYTALQWSLELAMEDVALALLKIHKADFKLENKAGACALHAGAAEGLVEFMKEATKAKADWRVQDDEGNTPLHYAVKKRNHSGLQFLLTRCPLSERNYEGNTALHLAVLNGDDASVKALITAKAELSVSNCDGQSPLDLAAPDSPSQRECGQGLLVAPL